MDTSTPFRDLTVAQFVDQLASGEPVPGGGAAAAIAGSLGAALVAMVAALSEGRPKYAEHAALLAESGPAGRALADRLLTLADEDASAYAGFGVAMKMPRDTDEEKAARKAALAEAAKAATMAPLRTVEACLEVVALAEGLAGRSNKNASSDLEVSSLMAVAAARSAAANVYINLPSLGDEELARELFERTDRLCHEVERLASQTRETVRGGDARPPLSGFGG
ncbi:MAG: cyclodeaminase/cyclohydrolase family protein [Chloroflexota bacterium]